jgi:hypothetical protein
MPTLTVSKRTEILSAIISDTFDAEEKAIHSQGVELGMKAYQHIYRDYLATMTRLPQSFFEASDCIDVQVSRTRTVTVPLGVERPQEHEMYSRVLHKKKGISKSVPVALRNQIIKWEERQAKYYDRRRHLISQLKVLFHHIRTEKRLLEVWPEAVKYIKNPETLPTERQVRVVKELIKTVKVR